MVLLITRAWARHYVYDDNLREIVALVASRGYLKTSLPVLQVY